jgi:PAS domain S-box-containing protein
VLTAASGSNGEPLPPPATERFFHALTDHSWDRVALLSERGFILYSSPSSTRIYWYHAQELVGRNAFDFVHPEDLSRARRIFRKCLAQPGQPIRIEYRALRKDGEYIWMETVARNLLEDAEIRAIVINEREITARRRSEAELLRTKARLEHLLNATPAVIFAATLAPRPVITFVSANTVRQFGYDKEEIVGSPDFWIRHVHPADAARVRARFSALRQGRPSSLEYRMLHADGSYRFVRTELARVRGKRHDPHEFVGFWLDITDRKRAEAALLATLECGEAMIRATSERELLESICAAIVKMGGYRMAWVGFPDSSGDKRILPAARAGAGKDYVDKAKITWAAGEPRGRGPVGRAMRTRKPVACRDLIHDTRFAPWRREATRRGYTSIIALPLLWRSECLGTLAIYSDQPDAFQREEAALLLNLASDIAYGLVALRTRADGERLQRELLEVSEREQRRIAQDLHDGLCQQLIGASFLAGGLQRRMAERGDPGAPELQRISDTLRTAAADARGLAHGLHPVDSAPRALMKALENFAQITSRMFGIECVFECPRPVLIRRRAAASHLYRIAQEAVGNAIKHGASTRVVIRLRNAGRGRVVLAIRDNGAGIPARLPAGSKGMGLQIMRYRAGMCGGVLDVRRSTPRGTLITCRLPAPGRAEE